MSFLFWKPYKQDQEWMSDAETKGWMEAKRFSFCFHQKQGKPRAETNSTMQLLQLRNPRRVTSPTPQDTLPWTCIPRWQWNLNPDSNLETIEPNNGDTGHQCCHWVWSYLGHEQHENNFDTNMLCISFPRNFKSGFFSTQSLSFWIYSDTFRNQTIGWILFKPESCNCSG